MKPLAIQYHVDLAQNILSMALENSALQNELYAQLIRLTSSDLPYSIQAWKLFAMAIPIYLPRQYSLLWLLKHHLARWKRLEWVLKCLYGVLAPVLANRHQKWPNFVRLLCRNVRRLATDVKGRQNSKPFQFWPVIQAAPLYLSPFQFNFQVATIRLSSLTDRQKLDSAWARCVWNWVCDQHFWAVTHSMRMTRPLPTIHSYCSRTNKR